VVSQPGYTLLNLRYGIRFNDWDVALFVDNATDKVAILNTSFLDNYNYQTINTPRTIGINARKKF